MPLRFVARRFPYLLFVLFCAGLAAKPLHAAGSREVAIAGPSSWVEELPLPTPAAPPEASTSLHYLIAETQTDVASRTTYRRNAFRIMTAAGLQEGGQVNLSFDPAYETLTFHHLRLIRNGQAIDRLDAAKIQILQQEQNLDYLLYNGELSALTILDDVRVGDVIDYAYSQTGWNPVFGDHYLDAFSLGWGTPVVHLRHRVIAPVAQAIFHRVAGTTNTQFRERTLGANRELIWEGRDLPTIAYDAQVPAWHELYPMLHLTDFPSWRAVVEWALPFYTDSKPADEAVREKASAIMSAASAPAERALLALRFVQDEIRYLGLETGANSHQPYPPEQVLARRFGDCKDKALLLVTLLREMEIEATTVLVHSSRRQTLRNWLPSPFAFNHVIVQLTLGDTTYVVDPTLSYQTGDLSRRHTTRYHTGLVVDPATNALQTWQQSGNDVRRIHVEEDFVITGLETPAKLHVRSTYSGRAAENMRSLLADTKREELTKSYLDFYARYFPEISKDRLLDWRDDEKENTIVVDEHYVIERIFVKQSDPQQFKADFYPTAINDYITAVGAGGRSSPLAVAHPVDVTSTTRIALFEPWPITPEVENVRESAFQFQRKIAGGGKNLSLTYQWRSLADHVTPEQFIAHSRALARANTEAGYQLTYTLGATQASAYRVNGGMVALAVTLSLTALAGCAWLIRRRTVGPPPLPPMNSELVGIGGWLILVALQVCLRPILVVKTFVPSLKTYFDLGTWEILTTPGNPEYQRWYAFALPLELTLNTFLFFGSLLGVFLFFARRRTFPPFVIGYLIFQVITALYEIWVSGVFSTISAQERVASFTTLIQTTAAAAIWIPYFLVSRRVRLTFTR